MFTCVSVPENRFWPLKQRQNETALKSPPPWRSTAYAHVPPHRTRGPTCCTMITMTTKTWRMRMTRTVAMTKTTQEPRNHDDIPIVTLILISISITSEVEPLRHAPRVNILSNGPFFLKDKIWILHFLVIKALCCFPQCQLCWPSSFSPASSSLFCFTPSDRSLKVSFENVSMCDV